MSISPTCEPLDHPHANGFNHRRTSSDLDISRTYERPDRRSPRARWPSRELLIRDAAGLSVLAIGARLVIEVPFPMSTEVHICPKCTSYTQLTTRVVAHETERLEYEVCSACNGVWLGWDELGPGKALLPFLVLPAMGSSFQRDQARGVCPACDPAHGLQAIPVGAFSVDRCPECEGVWFDGGELGPMLTDQGFAALLSALRTNFT
jgi:Zn-finger nucleic acid-binding protein